MIGSDSPWLLSIVTAAFQQLRTGGEEDSSRAGTAEFPVKPVWDCRAVVNSFCEGNLPSSRGPIVTFVHEEKYQGSAGAERRVAGCGVRGVTPALVSFCQIHETIESINQLKIQRDFMLSFSKDPKGYIQDLLRSQSRDLKVSHSLKRMNCGTRTYEFYLPGCRVCS